MQFIGHNTKGNNRRRLLRGGDAFPSLSAHQWTTRGTDPDADRVRGGATPPPTLSSSITVGGRSGCVADFVVAALAAETRGRRWARHVQAREVRPPARAFPVELLENELPRLRAVCRVALVRVHSIEIVMVALATEACGVKAEAPGEGSRKQKARRSR